MSKLKLSGRAVLLTVRNLGLSTIEIKDVDIRKGEQHTADYLKINPLHKVPVYVDNDFILTESRAIMCYLASAENKFYSTDLKKRALIDSRLFFDATNSYPAIRNFVRNVLVDGAKKIPQEQRDAIILWLNTSELFLGQSKWIAGDELTIADFSFLAHVTNAKAFGVSFDELPKLNDWYNRLKELPGFSENEEGAGLMAESMTSVFGGPLWK